MGFPYIETRRDETSSAARTWPLHRARASLLRIAAAFIGDESLEHEARVLCAHAVPDGPMLAYHEVGTEEAFRGLLARVLSWDAEMIEEKVAEVYAAEERS